MPKRLLAFLSLATLLGSGLLARFALGGSPHVQDEQGYLLLAEILTHFVRYAPAPVDGLLVAQEFQLFSPNWLPIFPPGWPVVLAFGVAIGVPWLVNPILAASLPWLTWAAFSPHLSERATRVACIIAALSPGILTLGASMMSHTLVLVCTLAGIAAVGSRAPTARACVVGGLAIGFIGLTRPLDVITVGGPLLAWAAWRTWRGQLGRKRLVALVAAASVGPCLMLADNTLLTGSPLVFPTDVYFEQGDTGFGPVYRPGCNKMGFGPTHGCKVGHEADGYTVTMSLNNLGHNARFFDRLFLGFPGGAILALLGWVMLARRLPAVAILPLSVPLGYALYWYHGISFGARFWHPVYAAAIPAAALAVAWGIDRFRTREWLAWAAIAIAAASIYRPLWAELSNHYWCVDAGFDQWLAETAGIERGVVLLNDRGQLRRNWPLTKQGGLVCRKPLSTGSAILHNDPFGAGAITWLHDPIDLDAVRAVAARHHGEPMVRVRRNVRYGDVSIQEWNGDEFSPPRELRGGAEEFTDPESRAD